MHSNKNRILCLSFGVVFRPRMRSKSFALKNVIEAWLRQKTLVLTFLNIAFVLGKEQNKSVPYVLIFMLHRLLYFFVLLGVGVSTVTLPPYL